MYKMNDQELAKVIRESQEWDGELLDELVRRADIFEDGLMDSLKEARENDDSDKEWDIVYKAADILNVKIEDF